MSKKEEEKYLIYTSDYYTYFENLGDGDFQKGLKKFCEDYEYNLAEVEEKPWEYYPEDAEHDFLEYWISEIDKLKANDNHFAILPIIGAWDGSHECYAVIVKFIKDAIDKITNVRFEYQLSIFQGNGYIEVSQSHHDGTNNFKIVQLNKKGEDYFNNNWNADFSKKTYHKKIDFNYG